MVTAFKTESIETLSEIKKSTSRVANISDDHTARIKLCEEELKS